MDSATPPPHPPLPDGDITSVQDSVSRGEIILSKIVEQTTNAQGDPDLLEQLLRQGYEARRSLEGHRATISPIHRIPSRILAKIFFYSLPEGEFLVPKHRESPLLLSQVCSEWKQLAQSTWRLWSSIAVIVSDRSSEPHLPLVPVWLARSGNHPLSIALFADPLVGSDRLRHTVHAFLDAFIAHIHRWWMVHLELPGPSHPPLLLAPTDGAPLLKKLHLNIESTDTRLQVELSTLFASAPHLNDLSCSGLGDILVRLHNVPWSQLTSLGIEDAVSIKDCLGLMRKCPQLSDCDFTVSSMDDTFPLLVGGPVLLDHLDTLSLQNEGDGLGGLFDNLLVPSLKNITLIDDTEGNRTWPQSEFLSLLSRSSRLSRLSLSNVPISSPELAQCLRMTPSLTELSVDDDVESIVFTDDLLDSLTLHISGNEQRSCLCPQLKCIRYRSQLNTSDGVFATMVESRWNLDQTINAVTRIEHVDVDIPAHNQEDRMRMELLVNEGLDISPSAE